MFEKYWGPAALPFQNLPDPAFLFPSAQHRKALDHLLYAVQHDKGAALLLGEVACGKTTLIRAFILLQLAGDKCDVAVVTNPSLLARDFPDEINQ